MKRRFWLTISERASFREAGSAVEMDGNTDNNVETKSNSQLGAAVPKPTVIRWRGERVRDRRFRPHVDTTEASRRDAQSF